MTPAVAISRERRLGSVSPESEDGALHRSGNVTGPPTTRSPLYRLNFQRNLKRIPERWGPGTADFSDLASDTPTECSQPAPPNDSILYLYIFMSPFDRFVS